MSTHYLALDIGSTTVVAIVIDLDTNAVVGAASAANSSETTSETDKRIGRSEWDLDAMTELAIENAAALVSRTNARPAAIGVTGQQQGLQLLDAALCAAVADGAFGSIAEASAAFASGPQS